MFPRYLRLLLRGAGEVVWRRSFSRLLRAPVVSEAEGRVTECASQRPSAELWSRVTDRERGILSSGQREGLPL